MMIETAAIIRAEGKILLLKIPRGQGPPANNARYALPKTLIKSGEEPESALLRFLQDDLGMQSSPGCLAGHIERVDRDRSIRQIAYHVTTRSIDEQALARHSLQWLDEEDLDSQDLVAADQHLLKIFRATSTTYYQASADAYFAATSRIDPAAFLMPLTELLPVGATILDVGCGSGRDLLWLKQRGFVPTGFELSSALAGLAREHSGCPVIEGDFCTFAFHTLQVQAIVLIGALVHLQQPQLPSVLQRISQALLPGGFILLSLKEGVGTSSADDGRTFTLWSDRALRAIFATLGFEVVDHVRQESQVRKTDIWLEYLLRQSVADAHATNRQLSSLELNADS